MRRRRFLATCATFAAAAAAPRKSVARDVPPGRLDGTDLALGHRLRQRDFPAPTETRRLPVLIVGAGIGGLSAGWRLQRAGFGDFEILELERRPGGNARHGENPVSAHPLGAHYLPLPPRECIAVRLLLADLGAIRGEPLATRPRYDETLLCHAPQERLYRDGLWQEGVIPHVGLAAGEREQIRRFLERMGEYRRARDARGRRAFPLPVALASREPRWRALDALTMRDWLLREGFDAPPLHWYVNYACRDDYGTDYRQASAWAGIHYFACRNGEAADAAPDVVLTAPEGNGWIVRRLAARLGPRLRTGAVVFAVRQARDHVAVDAWLPEENRSVRLRADRVVWAAPLFLLPHLAEGLPANLDAAVRGLSHAPWLVANLTLREPPVPGAGAGLAWDNVLYDSP
ncbi:MAG: NAD(P)-binding protein, partial [Rhodocyclaceae bacterium]|nr:NAD(P)-binding protein [Rhodocyclaceae bacterium]